MTADRYVPSDEDRFSFGIWTVGWQGAFWVVDALLAGGYDGPVHFDFKPPRTEDDEGVWASAAACMRNYLILRDKARAFRADPEVAEALRTARVDQLALPTLAEGESWRDIRGFTPDADALGRQGMAFERLDQLALEHLYGVR
jgi:xylose isomerase